MASFKINLSDYLEAGGLLHNIKLQHILIDSIYSPTSIDLHKDGTCYVQYDRKKRIISTYNIDVFVTAELDQSYKI